MRAVIYTGAGGTEVISFGEVPNPEVRPGHIRVRVHAAGLNRPDIIQRRGHYPAPKGWPADIPGLVAPILSGDADVVTGAKQGAYEKRFVSWVYNGLCRWLFGVRVTDLNSVKAFRREVMDGIPSRPDWHRFMVVIAEALGGRSRCTRGAPANRSSA